MEQKRNDVSHLAKFFIWLTIFAASWLCFTLVGGRSVEHGHAGYFFSAALACSASSGAAIGALFGRTSIGWVLGIVLFACGFLMLWFIVSILFVLTPLLMVLAGMLAWYWG